MSSSKEDRRNIYSLGFVSFFNDLASEMIYPLLPLFLTTVLGAGPAILGIIEGIADATASGFALISGMISDKMRRRKPIFTFGYLFSNLVRPLIGTVGSWISLFALRLSDRLGKGIRTAPRDALLADSVSPENRGMAFGFQRAMDHAGAIAGPLVAALLLGTYGLDLRTVFMLSAIPGILVIVLIIFLVREVRPSPPEEQTAIKLTGYSRPFYLYLASIFIFTLGNSSDAFLLLRAKDTGMALALVPLLWSVLHISKSASSFLGGFASDYLGRKATIITGWIIYGLVYLGFARTSSVAWIWVLFSIYGIYFGLTEGPQKAFLADLTTCDQRGFAYGLLNLAISFALLPASLLFGIVWQTYGYKVAFGMGSALAAFASICLLFAVPETKKRRQSSPLSS